MWPRLVIAAGVSLAVVIVACILWPLLIQRDPTKLRFRPAAVSTGKVKVPSEALGSSEPTDSEFAQEVQPPDDAGLNFTDAGTEAEAKALIARMLQVSKPWLNPAPTALAYTLQETKTHRSMDPHRWRKAEQKQYGPFTTKAVRIPRSPPVVTSTMNKDALNTVVSDAQQRLLRVGATLTTPLDYMANEPGSCKLRMVGQTTWKSRKVIGVDVLFDDWIQCRLGMGPHRHGVNDGLAWYYGTREVRLLIDAEKAVPLMIIAYTSQGGHYDPRKGTTWDFDPQFIPVGDGLAPRSISWQSKDDYRGRLRMRLEFQVVNGVWIFHKGEERWGGLISSNPDLSPLRRLGEDLSIWNWEIKDLQLQDAGTNSPVRIQTSPGN